MEIIDINRTILDQWYNICPESFAGITLDGNYLVYKSDRIDISRFNLSELMSDDSLFLPSLNVLTPTNVFDIIRLHALTILSNTPKLTTQSLKDEIDKIKSENELFSGVSVIQRENGEEIDEFLEIKDKNGFSRVFYNSKDLNIPAIYYELKSTSEGMQVTPDLLIAAISEKAVNIRNQEYVANEVSYNSQISSSASDLMDEQIFYDTLNSDDEFIPEIKEKVDDQYSYLSGLATYQDYLLPTLKNRWNNFEYYVSNLRITEEREPLGVHQIEACNRFDVMTNREVKKAEVNTHSSQMVQKKGPVLSLKKSFNYDRAGFINTLNIIWTVVGIAIILTALTLFIIK